MSELTFYKNPYFTSATPNTIGEAACSPGHDVILEWLIFLPFYEGLLTWSEQDNLHVQVDVSRGSSPQSPMTWLSLTLSCSQTAQTHHPIEVCLSLSPAHLALPPETVQASPQCLTTPSYYVLSTLPPRPTSHHVLCFIPYFRTHLSFCFCYFSSLLSGSLPSTLGTPSQSASVSGFESEWCLFGVCISRHITQPF